MLFLQEGSGLVRLSDTVKAGLRYCERSTSQLLALVHPYRRQYALMRAAAEKADRGDVALDVAEGEIQEALAQIPQEVGLRIASIVLEIGDHARTTVLTCCFCLESYVNSLAFFLFKQTDLVGLVRAGYETTAEVSIRAIDQMAVREKWRTIGQLRPGSGFNTGEPPFQDLEILFKFRNDLVHDKVIELDRNRSGRYNNKLPDPVFGNLDLGHALYAASTYWGMVVEVHRLLNIEMSEFHRHYDLRPWSDDAERDSLQRLTRKYREGP